MKTVKQTITWSILILVFVTGCKKYEEGPGFSLRSKKERVANNWKIVYAYDYKDSIDVTQDYVGETWEFKNGGAFTERDNGSIDKTGTWEFANDKERITIKFPLDVDNYDILKLRENEIWLKDTDEELHLVPAN